MIRIRTLSQMRTEKIGEGPVASINYPNYELLHREEIPREVSLDEMVELSKSFCDVKSKDFVNGVLDAIGPSKHASS